MKLLTEAFAASVDEKVITPGLQAAKGEVPRQRHRARPQGYTQEARAAQCFRPSHPADRTLEGAGAKSPSALS